MSTASHATIGAIIASVIKRPEIALPLAFLSHFIADIVPHYGIPGHGGFSEALKHKSGKFVGVTDPVFLLTLFAILIFLGVPLYVYLAAILAISPDIEWLISYLFYETKNKKPPHSFIGPTHAKIQWCEHPWGYIIELTVIAIGWTWLIKYWR